jgi:hypothetical protein
VKPNGIFSGSKVSRERAKTPAEPKLEYESTKDSLQKPTDSIENSPSDIIALTHADDDLFSDSIAGPRTPTSPLQTYLSNQLPIRNTIFYGATAMDQYPTPPFENSSFLASPSGTNNYYTTTELHFDFRVPPGHKTSPPTQGDISLLDFFPRAQSLLQAQKTHPLIL